MGDMFLEEQRERLGCGWVPNGQRDQRAGGDGQVGRAGVPGYWACRRSYSEGMNGEDRLQL